MKIFTRWLIILAFSYSTLHAEEADTIIYMDVNGTVTLYDGVLGKSLRTGVNQAAASQMVAQWHKNSESMSLENFVKFSLTTQREKYLDKPYLDILGVSSLADLPQQNRELQILLFNKIPEILELHKEELGRGVYEKYQGLLTDLQEKAEQFPNGIAISFLNFVEHLVKSSKLSLVISTFGSEGEMVQETLVKQDSLKNFPVHYSGQFEKGHLKLKNGAVLTTPYEIQAELSKVGIHVIRNNFEEWKGKAYHHTYGKPMYLIPGKRSMFFDDNILNEKGVSCVAPKDQEGNDLDLQSLINEGTLIKVNIVQVIQDPHYFTKKYVQACIIRSTT
jgi:hypothetical protein